MWTDRPGWSGSGVPVDIFGEVPITLGTLFPVGFRAAEPSWIMRIEPHDYPAVANPVGVRSGGC